jgi:DNA-binding PadR family transcriptional regulator
MSKKQELTLGSFEERGGRPKRYYTVENAGRQALIEAERIRHSLVPNLKTALA